MVSLPVPRSVAPTRRLKDPSSLSLITADAISIFAIPEPCMAIAIPTPLTLLPFLLLFLNFSSHLNIFFPLSIHSSSLQLFITISTPSLPSPIILNMGDVSPSFIMFFFLISTGSIPSFSARISMADSRAKFP